MRGTLFVAVWLVAAPAVASADVAVGVDVNVHVDVAVRAPVDALSPPSTVDDASTAPKRLPAPGVPKRWFAVGYSGSLNPSVDDAYRGQAVRVDADLWACGSWRFGLTLARGTGDALEDYYYTPKGYVGQHADLTDTRAVVYVARAARRGRFEVRAALGAGLVATVAKSFSWFDSHAVEMTTPTTSSGQIYPLAEASASVAVDLFGPVSLAIGPVVTLWHERFAVAGSDLERTIDVSLYGGLRWAM